MPLAPLRSELLRWARAAHPREACALVLDEPWELVPLENVSAAPRAAFELDPLELLAALKAAGARARGVAHSHPSGKLEPSGADLAARAALGGLEGWIVVTRGERVEWTSF
jgi:proteasome lid subunit RPN8/RPN11